ncbi:hypothetical protein XENOCAPTIV_017925 [Xenoophorus captivus]|uniref:Uncharacterized protein n=1 Tax=Xenoophorus captivus TaxID=1517983 RepID=A0ABV0S7L0_9TELE
MVRQRGGKAGLGRKDSSEVVSSRDSGVLESDVAMETMSAAEQAMEKVKKRYRKKKTKLEESFPSYLQSTRPCLLCAAFRHHDNQQETWSVA